MKKVLMVLLILNSFNIYAQNNVNALSIINDFIKMHNNGSETAIKSFISSKYEPDLLKKIKNMDKHVEFYQNVIDDFGDLNPVVYEVHKETPLSVIVHLIREKDNIFDKNIDPKYILSLELDLS